MAARHTHVESLAKLNVSQLKELLRERRIPFSGYKKAELLALVKNGVELYEPLETDDKEESLVRRITIKGVTLPAPDSCVVSDTDDLKDLPPVSLTDLLIYLRIQCKWGDERLRNYKQDDGHKMYKDSHITKVDLGLMPRNPDYVYVKAKCIPEQSQSAEQYKVWLLLKSKSAVIESAGCTCVASDDGTCKHVVALLFSSVDFNLRHLDRHTQVGTDVKCKWNQARQESTPLPITSLDLRQNTSSPMVEPTPLQYIPLQRMPISKEQIDQEVVKLLREHAPNACLLGVVDLSDEEIGEEEDQQPSLMSLASEYKRAHDLSVITDMSAFMDFVGQRLTQDILTDITTVPQGTDEWLDQRNGRLTGSKMGTVLHFRMNNKPDNSLVRSVFERSTVNTAAIQYGRDYEPVARTLYLAEKEKECHRKLTVKETGLNIHRDFPFIGASPDGVVSCACCGTCIIEIKCCESRQNESATQIAESGTYHVYIDNNGDFQLKEKSPWYTQMIVEMAVTGCLWGEFILFTNLGIEYCKVPFSHDHWSKVKDKSIDVYQKYILPKL